MNTRCRSTARAVRVRHQRMDSLRSDQHSFCENYWSTDSKKLFRTTNMISTTSPYKNHEESDGMRESTSLPCVNDLSGFLCPFFFFFQL